MAISHREFTPDQYPPFPEGLPPIKLQTISLAKLEAGDATEQDRLFKICKTQGFFYLDFTGTSSPLPQQSEEISRLAEDVFKLPLEEKLASCPHPTDVRLVGYKPSGRGVVDKLGTKSTNEFFNLPTNDLASPHPSHPYPSLILTHRPLLTSYMSTAHSTGLSILSILATKLGLAPDTFTHLHRITSPSGSHMRMTRGPPRLTRDAPEIQTAGHTDFGSITILFNWPGGLQIWSTPNHGQAFEKVLDPTRDVSEGATWLWVVPRPGCAIVNLGDAAVKWTNGLFCSGRHRVVPAPGEQGVCPRYSLVYFVRPEDGAVLRTLQSELVRRPEGVEREVTAKDWIDEQVRTMLGIAVPAKA